MLPSRGLRRSSQLISIGRRRIESSSTRQFSSSNVQNASLRSSPLLSHHQFRASSKTKFSNPNVLLRNAAAVRFASSTPSSALNTASSAPDPAHVASSTSAFPPESVDPTPFDGMTDFSADTLADVPHYIGYLKQLGLEYGYGPTAGMEWVLEHVHVLAGTPWWMSILLTGILARAICSPLYMIASDNAAKIAHITPYTKPLREKMLQAQATGDMTMAMQASEEMKLIYRRAGASIQKGFLPFVGGLASFGQFFITRGMSHLPVHSLETGGAFWFPNLIVPDPYLILPVASAAMMYQLLRQGGESGVKTLSPGVQKAFQIGLPTISLMITAFMPAACQLGFLAHGIVGFAQATLMRQAWFRDYFSLTPMPKPPTGPTANYKGNMNRSAVLSQEELMARFQRTDSREPESTVSKVMAKAVAPIKDVMAPVVDEAKIQRKKLYDRRRASAAKNDTADSKRYEEKRQKQLAEAQRRQRERNREDRALRKEYEDNEG